MEEQTDERELALALAGYAEKVINELHHETPERLRQFIERVESGELSISMVCRIVPDFAARLVIVDGSGELVAQLAEFSGADNRH